jgi:hypothetical protein
MTIDLERINAERRRRRKAPLTLAEAKTALANTPRACDDGFDTLGFLFALETGVPFSPSHGFSTGALLGATLHSEPSPAASSSYDSGSSSPSDSSSSSDGGGSGGGDGGGSGGGD